MVIYIYHTSIDIAKKRHEAYVMDDEGTQVPAMPVPNTQRGAARFATALRKRVDNDRKSRDLLPGGYRPLPALDVLPPAGSGVSNACDHPIQSGAVRNLYIRKSKTDRRDSFALADLLRINQIEETCMASEAVLKLQALSSTRFALVD